MYLSKLELLGFKSFAQKTTVTFNDGITSIVGPNGCGKTNIVDAIRWCLGEQKSGALRSDKMENVIFNGTSAKKPMGMAEVSLTIHNTKGVLPTEYSEVTITRRIFRSGESEYLLNKNICRLKDITNLFMDTGIGANAYSVIELKMVETILSNKAEERRTMFEEAAGVNKYKLRRRLALRKLEDVKADLTRVNDIVSEVEKNVRSLERQAKRADKYNKISATLRELELDLAERELALYTRERKNSKLKKEEDFKKKIELENRLAVLDGDIKNIKGYLAEIESQLKVKQAEVTSQTDKIYNLQKELSVAGERKKSLEGNIRRYKDELEELNSQLKESENIITQGNQFIVEIESKISGKESDKQEAEKQVLNSKNSLDEKRNHLKVESDLLMERFKEITNRENDLSNIEKLLETKKASIAKANERIQILTNNIAKTVGYIEELNQEKRKTEEEIEKAESVYAQKQKEKEELEKKISGLRSRELEDKSIISGIADKISFIQTLVENLEGVSKGAKALIENSGWASGERALVAHIGASSEEYRFAIEASLKNNLNNILVESLNDIKNGIEYLKSNDIGKASFFLNKIEERKEKRLLERLQDFFFKKRMKSLQKEKGFIGWANDLIHTEEKWKPFFDNILFKTAITDSLETAFSLTRKFNGFNFATLNGDYLDNSGIIEGGSLPKEDDSVFGRKQLLEKFKRELPQKEKELADLRKTIEEEEYKLGRIDLKILSEQGRLLVNDLSNIEKQIAQFEFEKKKASDEIEKIRQEIQDLAVEANNLDNERMKITDILKVQREEKQKADEQREKLEKEFGKFEEEYDEVIYRLNNINLGLERLLGEKKNTENSIKRAEETIEMLRKSIAKRKEDISTSAAELESLSGSIEENRNGLAKLEEGKSILLNEENEIDEKYKSVRLKISEIEDEQNALRKDREVISESIHASEMSINEYGLKIENLKEHINENYSLTLEEKTYDDLDIFDYKQRSEEVQLIKQQVRNLGPINLLAYSEYEEERERFEFLSKQRNDLIESEKDIVKTIEEINNTAQSKFMETFEKIRENFINVFRALFNPGDEADLRLEEPVSGAIDPLEAKIEIIAKPRGKRPTSIELLSGGEKTLTAIALLFAIYLVKPSPFCILDEIDAPLDDANIDRFTQIIRDFSKDTQFIVVTHNKRTMEAADTLYGVTMQEEGVSKLVGVRFNEELSTVL
jgi:chromosome segregation protein